MAHRKGLFMRTSYWLLAISLCLSVPALAEELGDGTYLCKGGLTTAMKPLNRKWTPIGQPVKDYEVTISNNSTTARIDGLDYDCKTVFFEYLGCSTGFYHFTMNINNGRFTFDHSYGFIRGETPAGDAETVSTTLGFCAPAPVS